MPITVTSTTGGTNYADPFLPGMRGPTVHLKIDLSGLTVNEVDSDGYLKPGVPFSNANPAVLVGSGVVAYGVTVEATLLPLATIPPTNTTLGTETGDCFVAVTTYGVINRDAAEDNLGRAYTADEIAGLTTVAGSRFQLTTT